MSKLPVPNAEEQDNKKNEGLDVTITTIDSTQSPSSISMPPEQIWEPIPVSSPKVKLHSMEAYQIMNIFSDGTSPPTTASLPLLDNTDSKPEAKPSKKQYLEDHHVVLKENGDTTPATRLYKDYTRAIFPRSKAFDMEQLLSLQNQVYCCRYPGRAALPAEFWVSKANANKHPDWTLDMTTIRFSQKKDVPFVPASEDCIRHDVGYGGGRTPQERAQQQQSKVAKKDPSNPHKRFREESLTDLNENLKRTCGQWIQESTDVYDMGGREKMVALFWEDFGKEKKMLEHNPLVSEATGDGYNQTRQTAHDKLVVHIANELGNSMVDWYKHTKCVQQQKKKPAVKRGA